MSGSVTADILTYHSRKRRGLWWLNSTKLLLFQGLDVVHMGSCHTVMAYCNTWIPKGLFIVTINDTKSETQVKKSARMKASCWNSNEGSRTSLTICLNTSDRANGLECNSHINKTRGRPDLLEELTPGDPSESALIQSSLSTGWEFRDYFLNLGNYLYWLQQWSEAVISNVRCLWYEVWKLLETFGFM